MIFISDGLDLSISGINNLRIVNDAAGALNAKTRRLAGSVWFCLLI
jgi:hypothetical protein